MSQSRLELNSRESLSRPKSGGRLFRRPCVPRDVSLKSALCYHGWLRVGTGFALLSGMDELEKSAEKINLRASA